MRRLVEGLRPPALDDLGLVEAVRELADVAAPYLPTSRPSDLPRLPAAVEVAAYRVVQEALTNVARHSAAGSAVVTICRGPRSAARGGRPTTARACCQPRPDGVGLSSMRERAEEIGGRFEVFADPGCGTRVRVELPLVGAAP